MTSDPAPTHYPDPTPAPFEDWPLGGLRLAAPGVDLAARLFSQHTVLSSPPPTCLHFSTFMNFNADL